VGFFSWCREEVKQLKKELIDHNRKGVVLKGKEVELLLLIYKHRLLTTKQIFRWMEMNGGMKYRTLTQRLSKFVQYKLLVKHEYSLGVKGIRFYYYRIGIKGMEVLADNGDVPLEELENSLLHRVSNIKNLDHYLATQEAVLKFSSTKRDGDTESLHPHKSPLLLDNTLDEKPTVIPDWILRNDLASIYIELDSGTETMTEIKDKVERYQTFAAAQPDTRHFVTFISIDHSFRTKKYYGDKTRRIGNMKKAILGSMNASIENLEIFVMPLRRAEVIIEKILNGTIPYDTERRRIEAHVAKSLFTDLNREFAFELKEIEREEVYFGGTKEVLKIDRFYEVRNEGGNLIETIGLLCLHEGLMKSLDSLDYSYHLVKNQKTKRRIDRLIAIYDHEEELKADILANQYDGLLIGDTQTWNENPHVEPKFYKQVSPYKLEVTTYD
jgi:hypothetical protein